MTEPQVWVLIGVFAASMFGMISIVTLSFTRTVNSAIGGLRESMNAKFEAVDARFEVVDARFEAMNAKFDVLDRDIQALSRHVFGTDPR